MRKSQKKKPTKGDGDWMSKFKIFDKKEKEQQQQGLFQDELDEEEGEEELIEHVNLQNSVRNYL